MTEDPDQALHVLVIGAWHEHAGLRARITCSDPEDATRRTSVGVGGSDRVLELVAEWLKRIGADVKDREG